MRLTVAALGAGILIGAVMTGAHYYLDATPASDTAAAVTTLTANTSLISGNGDYQLLMTAGGDLVENSLYGISPIIMGDDDLGYLGGGNATALTNDTVTGTFVGSDVIQIWHSGTGGHPGARAVVQGDGNFVIYSSTNAVLWSTGTAGHPGAKLVVQSDANAVLYDGSQPLWSTKRVSIVAGPNGSSVNFRNCPSVIGTGCTILQALPSGTGVTMLCWESVAPVGWTTPPPSNKWFYVLVDGTQDNLGFIDAAYVSNQITTPQCIGETKPGQSPPPAPTNAAVTPPASTPVPTTATPTDAAPNSGPAPQPSTPTVTVAPPPTTAPAPAPPATFTETVGGPTSTWTDYSDAGGIRGATIVTGQSVQVTCVVQGFRVADGNTNWYRIASSPWSNAYYASADAFYNDGATTGSLIGTPFVDPKVPAC